MATFPPPVLRRSSLASSAHAREGCRSSRASRFGVARAFAGEALRSSKRACPITRPRPGIIREVGTNWSNAAVALLELPDDAFLDDANAILKRAHGSLRRIPRVWLAEFAYRFHRGDADAYDALWQEQTASIRFNARLSAGLEFQLGLLQARRAAVRSRVRALPLRRTAGRALRPVFAAILRIITRFSEVFLHVQGASWIGILKEECNEGYGDLNARKGLVPRGLIRCVPLVYLCVLAACGSELQRQQGVTPTAVLNVSGGPVYDFGQVFVDTHADRELTITNIGSMKASQMSASFYLSQNYLFVGGEYPGVGGSCTADLAPREYCTINVRFASEVDWNARCVPSD